MYPVLSQATGTFHSIQVYFWETEICNRRDRKIEHYQSTESAVQEYASFLKAACRKGKGKKYSFVLMKLVKEYLILLFFICKLVLQEKGKWSFPRGLLKLCISSLLLRQSQVWILLQENKLRTCMEPSHPGKYWPNLQVFTWRLCLRRHVEKLTF